MFLFVSTAKLGDPAPAGSSSMLHPNSSPADTCSCVVLLSVIYPKCPTQNGWRMLCISPTEEGWPSGKPFTPDFHPAKGLLGWSSAGLGCLS